MMAVMTDLVCDDDVQFWYSWRNQIEEFSSTHTVVAVDLRGYNGSSKPSRTLDYNIDNLMLDVVELVKVCVCTMDKCAD
jgi:pimeloyl-ACP methyl ester carboxylesterase